MDQRQKAEVFRRAAELIETEGWKAGGANEEGCSDGRCIFVAVYDAGTAARHSWMEIMNLDLVLIDYFKVGTLENVFKMNDSLAPYPHIGKTWAIHHLTTIADSLKD